MYKVESNLYFEEFFLEGRVGVSPDSGSLSALQVMANLIEKFCSRQVWVCEHVCIQ